MCRPKDEQVQSDEIRWFRMSAFRVGQRTLVRAVVAGTLLTADSQSVLSQPVASGSSITQGLPCDGSPKRRADGSIAECRLAAEHRVGGITLPVGTELAVRATGVVREAVLSAPTPVDGEPLPGGARLYFDGAGLPHDFFLPHVITYKGHRLRRPLEAAFGHRLYPDGKLRAAILDGEEVIDGVPCVSMLPLFRGFWKAIHSSTEAWFYPDGRLQQCFLGRDVTIHGQAFKRGDIVHLTHDGALDPTPPVLGEEGPRGRYPEWRP